MTVPLAGQSFQALSAKLGGFNPAALHSFMYWNNPFALKSWTMNVVELLMVAGAALGLAHAIGILRRHRNPAPLAIWIAAICYMLCAEIPIYFPRLIGADPNKIFFLHNEFTLGFFYDRAPLYVIALYPAMLYPLYILVDRTGIFGARLGFIQGALCVAFMHHCLYEIFDQFGPQYGWWVWNYSLFTGTLASVPISSMFTFAFFSPFAFALLARVLIARPAEKRIASGRKAAIWQVLGGVILTGLLTEVLGALLSPGSYYALLPVKYGIPIVVVLSYAVIAGAALLTYRALGSLPHPAEDFPAGYPLNFLAAYLAVFAALWVYALPEVLSAAGGWTPRGTPVGSLQYVIGCYVCGLFILYKGFGLHARRRVERSHP
jgi:hypothetical protein